MSRTEIQRNRLDMSRDIFTGEVRSGDEREKGGEKKGRERIVGVDSGDSKRENSKRD